MKLECCLTIIGLLCNAIAIWYQYLGWVEMSEAYPIPFNIKKTDIYRKVKASDPNFIIEDIDKTIKYNQEARLANINAGRYLLKSIIFLSLGLLFLIISELTHPPCMDSKDVVKENNKENYQPDNYEFRERIH